jgi:hypothetical protein
MVEKEEYRRQENGKGRKIGRMDGEEDRIPRLNRLRSQRGRQTEEPKFN